MRYLFFTYMCNNSDKFAQGNIGIISEKFPNMEYLKKVALKRNKYEMDVIITGWQEFNNEQDYNLFFADNNE